MAGRFIGQHVDRTPHSPNGQPTGSAGRVSTGGVTSPARVGQMSGGEIQQGRAVPPSDRHADTIINGTGDASEGGYGKQFGPGSDRD